MKFFKLLAERVQKMNRFSRRAAQLGFGVMVCVYITALFAYLIAPHVPSYLRAMTVYYGAMEVAPACLSAGVCAAIICDIIFYDRGVDDESGGKKKP